MTLTGLRKDVIIAKYLCGIQRQMLRGGDIFIGMPAEWEMALVTDTTHFKTHASSHARPALDP